MFLYNVRFNLIIELYNYIESYAIFLFLKYLISLFILKEFIFYFYDRR